MCLHTVSDSACLPARGGDSRFVKGERVWLAAKHLPGLLAPWSAVETSFCFSGAGSFFFCFLLHSLDVSIRKMWLKNLKRSQVAFIPGIRPVRTVCPSTIDGVLTRLTMAVGPVHDRGSVCCRSSLVVSAMLPFYLGGTSTADRISGC